MLVVDDEQVSVDRLGQYRVADWVRNSQPSAMQNSLSSIPDAEMISFSLGLPGCAQLPKAPFVRAVNTVLEKFPTSIQYMPPLENLKKQVAQLMLFRGVTCQPENIFITSGAQQGISLLVKLFLNNHDSVGVETYTYPGFMQAVEPFSPEYKTFSTDITTGADIDEVESILKSKNKPKLIYLVPSGGNPQAVSISEAKKARLAVLAEKYQVPIIEDDPYGFFNYGEDENKAIAAYSSDWVFYVGSFSKLIAPSLRVGWIVAPKKFHAYLATLKEGSDINLASFGQQIVSSYLSTISVKSYIADLNSFYKARRDSMHSALQQYLPKSCKYFLPKSGFFFWIKLPDKFDTNHFCNLAITKYKVSFISGDNFKVGRDNSTEQFIRLNFSFCNENVIEEGVFRLGQAFNEMLAIAHV